MKAKVNLVQNVQYELRDKDGNIKPLFEPNKLTQLLIKLGLLSPFHPQNLLFGRHKDNIKLANLVTNAGMAGIASRINGADSEAAFTYIAVGTGTTAAAVTDTTLETETAASGLSRAAATVSRQTTDVTNDTARLTRTFTVTGTVAVTESGVFNAASSGVLLCRQTFSAINVVNGDQLTITWDIDVD